MATKKIKRRVYKRKIPVKKEEEKQKQNQTSRSVGNIVNINVPQPKKRQYTRRQSSKSSQPSSSTSVVTQIHQIPQYSIPQMLGTNTLKSSQLEGQLGLERNNQINNQSPFSIGGNQQNKILTSAERANALMTNISNRQPEDLLGILNEQDNIKTPKKPISIFETTEVFKPEPGARQFSLFDLFKPSKEIVDKSAEAHRNHLLKYE